MTPWVTHGRGPTTPSVDGLQFGHGGDAVGDLVRVVEVEPRPKSFNSATAVTPWVTHAFPGTNHGCRRFNSATAVTPWVTRHLNPYGATT